MENIGFNITEYDIREYLKKHKNDVAIKYKEAMFVKYMREHQEITQESLEILMEKYNWQDSVVNGIYYRDSNGILKSEALSDFNSYLDGITNLDISGICYIMVPVLSYYSDYKYHIYNWYKELSNVSRKLEFDINYEQMQSAIRNMKDDYLIAFDDRHIYQDNDVYFRFSKNESKNMIESYSHIHGEDNVKQIRKIIRERV